MSKELSRGRHAFILGTGIAGLSVAEILSRNGWSITLLESSAELGGDASRRTQNWLHTGWLYAGLPHPSAMLGCARALRLFRTIYDPVLSARCVNVEVKPQGVVYPPSNTGWFDAERVQYLYATRTHDFNWWQRLIWSHYLALFPLRRLRKLGYSTAPAANVSLNLSALMNLWENDAAGSKKYVVVPSTDARIHTRRVLESLLHLLGQRTTVICNAQYQLEHRGNRTALRMGGELHVPDLIVLATGRHTPQCLRQMGCAHWAKMFRSICSPIVVLNRALDLPNFIRFTPKLPETVNHMKYCIGASDVSTLGSYDYFPCGQQPDISPFIERMCRSFNVSTRDVAGSYFGNKTELTGDLPRRYNHAIEQVNGNTFFAIAGKFSQFPLLVHEFAHALGLNTNCGNDRRGCLAMNISPTAPERVLANGRQSPTRISVESGNQASYFLEA